MKILLVAVNAKYIHSNLAVRSLKMYAEQVVAADAKTAAGSMYTDDAADCTGRIIADDVKNVSGCMDADGPALPSALPHIDIAEYTINQPLDQILRDIYTRRPDMTCFSCYIWNIRYVRTLVRELKKVLPQTDIWLGGPEVSYDAAEVLRELPEVSGVMKGEGEETFAELVKAGIALRQHVRASVVRTSEATAGEPGTAGSYCKEYAGIYCREAYGKPTPISKEYAGICCRETYSKPTPTSNTGTIGSSVAVSGSSPDGVCRTSAAFTLRNQLLAAIPGITWRVFCGLSAGNSQTSPNAQIAESFPPNSDWSTSEKTLGGTGQIIENPWRPAMDMNLLPFVCDGAEDLSHRIIYYESSRGCPFSCSYCLSSVDKHLRFRDMEMVKRELRFFLDRRVPQVKFVDRTFNCDHRRAMEIWQFLADNDNGVTNFHFEIAADLLTPEEIALIGSMRPGLIQLEIGVQSTNPDTIREIRRTMDLARLSANVRAVASAGNVHQHLDLIAGLPYEDLNSFRRSFDDVYALHPQQLQLGFLKVLKGSCMDERRGAYSLICGSEPPYEVLSTRWLSFDDVILLKGVEEMVETYYNSGQFSHTIAALEREFASAFGMYQTLAEYYRQHVPAGVSQARAARYELLLGFIKEIFSVGKVQLIKQADDFRQRRLADDAQQDAKQADNLHQDRQTDIPQDDQPNNNLPNERTAVFRELLTYDYYLRENAKSRPAFAGEQLPDKETVRLFYEKEAAQHHFLPDYTGYDKNQMRRMTHLETFPHLGKTILFDYGHRDPLTGDARVRVVEASSPTVYL